MPGLTLARQQLLRLEQPTIMVHWQICVAEAYTFIHPGSPSQCDRSLSSPILFTSTLRTIEMESSRIGWRVLVNACCEGEEFS